MNVSKSDFKGDDYEFAAGTIKGIRSWGMDEQGRLHGVTFRDVWRPGENVAACRARRTVACPKAEERPAPFSSQVWTTCSNEPTCDGFGHKAPTDHAFDPDCECGFWAYDEHTFTEHGDVTGIIAGYGKTTIGTRGFRCEKATILALCRERDDDELSLSAWLRLQQLYRGAEFYDERDAMLAAHGGALKSWGPVGDDFWDQPVTPAESDFNTWQRRYLTNLMTPGANPFRGTVRP